MVKVIVHIDLNAFFVRAEEIRNPELENKAVAIGHLGRGGIVSTCSYEARKFGVKSGMPMNKAVKLCPHLLIVPPDYRFYITLSHEFKKYIRSITPKVESASVDELFADFTDVIKGKRNVEAYFRQIQKGLYEKTQLKCSIGVGPTKFLAKMASDYQKPMGLTIIRRKDIKNILYPLPIEDMFGIGKKSAPRLREVGIATIGDLAAKLDANDPVIMSLLGKGAEELHKWLKGYGSDEVITEYAEYSASLGSSSAFTVIPKAINIPIISSKTLVKNFFIYDLPPSYLNTFFLIITALIPITAIIPIDNVTNNIVSPVLTVINTSAEEISSSSVALLATVESISFIPKSL